MTQYDTSNERVLFVVASLNREATPHNGNTNNLELLAGLSALRDQGYKIRVCATTFQNEAAVKRRIQDENVRSKDAMFSTGKAIVVDDIIAGSLPNNTDDGHRLSLPKRLYVKRPPRKDDKNDPSYNSLREICPNQLVVLCNNAIDMTYFSPFAAKTVSLDQNNGQTLRELTSHLDQTAPKP